MFRRFISLFSVICITLWILPLGAFIKPSQEKVACGGARAMHMCSMMEKANPSQDGKISFSNASGVEKTNKSTNGSGGNDFISSSSTAQNFDNNSKFFEFDFIVPKPIFFAAPSPVPKA